MNTGTKVTTEPTATIHDIDRLIDKIESSAAMDIAGRSKYIHDLRAAIEADRKKFVRNENDRGNDNDHRKRRGSIVNNASASSEPVAWISRVKCVGPEYGKEYFGRLPLQSLNPLFYEHVPLYSSPQPLSESDIPAEPVKVDAKASVPSDALQGLADRAYCQYIEQMSRPECKGVEYKLENDKFGVFELAAHNKAYEHLGRHRAFSEAVALLDRYGNTQQEN